MQDLNSPPIAPLEQFDQTGPVYCTIVQAVWEHSSCFTPSARIMFIESLRCELNDLSHIALQQLATVQPGKA